MYICTLVAGCGSINFADDDNTLAQMSSKGQFELGSTSTGGIIGEIDTGCKVGHRCLT